MTLRRLGSIALTCALLLGLPAVAGAAERGDFQLRGRVISIIPDDDSGEISGVAGSGVDVDSQATVEVDLTWFLSSNVALELIAATAQHDISGNGTAAGLGKIADAAVLPPTLTLQYHWNTDGKVQPYLGAGINYTIFYDEDVTPSLEAFLMTTADIDMEESFGFAAQAGIDFMLSDNWFFNIDLKYIDMDTTAVIRDETTRVELARVNVDINPFVPGIGVGYRW